MSNATATYTVVGMKEDVDDKIYRVSPEETPFVSMIGRDSVDSTTPEWLRDSLRSPGSNAAVEGADASYAAQTQPERLSNKTQIIQDTLSITGTTERVAKYGRDKESARLKAKKAVELKKDIEWSAIGNGPPIRSRTASTTLKTATVQVTSTNQTDAYGGRAIGSTRINGNAWRGDSGGPFVTSSGRVGGLVFAAAAAEPGTGYALTAESTPPLRPTTTRGRRFICAIIPALPCPHALPAHLRHAAPPAHVARRLRRHRGAAPRPGLAAAAAHATGEQ